MSKSQNKKRWIGLILSLFPALAVLLRLILKYAINDFDYKVDLPCHLCNFMALAAPFIMWNRNRFLLGILYFWVFVGTLNANITPDIEFGFPHFTYLAYWILHTGLLILPVYAILNYGLKISWKDYLWAILTVNCFLILSLVVNFTLNSNYMYSRHKPPVASLIDYLGPWPWYLLSGQILALTLCFIVMIPWLFYWRLAR